MGMFKRILRQTSHKLLAKLGAPRSSHRLVLNSHHHSTNASQLASANSKTSTKGRSARNRLKRSGNAKRLLMGNSNSALSEALLLAAKNYLPPVQFHHVHGPNVQLSPNKFVARRTQSFCQALVFSNRVILPNERVYIKVLEIAKGWSGTIRFGFTSVDPATLRYQMPKHACPDMTNAGHTWARALADEVVRRNSVIHFSYNNQGYIHYGINNQDCGVFNANVKTSQHLWFIVDIYGLTATVELIDPRIHSNQSTLTGEVNFSSFNSDEQLGEDSMRTMYKSTGHMDELLNGTAFSVRSKQKKKKTKKYLSNSRNLRQQSALLYGQWSPENLMSGYHHHHHSSHQPTMLPNLSSIILPPSQQNIYSPMPGVRLPVLDGTTAPTMSRNVDSHDYYQIMTTNNQPPISSTNRLPPMVANRTHDGQLIAMNSSTSSSARSGIDNDADEICQQFDNFQINGEQQQQKQQSTIRASKSAATSSQTPVAATRRRPQANNSVQTTTNSKRTPEAHTKDSQSKLSPHSAASKSLSSTKQARAARHSSSNNCNNLSKSSVHQQTTATATTTASRDMNNNSPPSKDCPICFERPINCVLYQCGHMCTCYECGVKQWKTQSRTCPICRTIIKDVIKTYMS